MSGERYAGVAVGLCGFALLAATAGWLPALAVLVMMWGNNLERHAESKK